MSVHCFVRFDPAPSRLRAWRKHTSLPAHPDALSPEDLYLRALPIFESVRYTLLSRGCLEMRPSHGSLWALELRQPPASRHSLSPVSPTAPRIFAVPADLASFAQYAAAWAEMFHDQALFRAILHEEHGLMVHTPDPVLADVFYLLQLILPGCLVLVKEVHGDEVFNTRESRPFPSQKWMASQSDSLRAGEQVSSTRYRIHR